jgi:hypothetical protein
MNDETEYKRLLDARDAFLLSRDAGEKDQRLVGTHVHPLELIWTTTQRQGLEPIQEGWYDNILRTDVQGQALYPDIVSEQNLNREMVPAGGSRSSTVNTSQGQGRKLDMFLNRKPEAAHLISHAPLCHKAYGFIAEAATGKKLGPGPVGTQNRLKLLNGVCFQGESRRVPNTGLKHHKYNKMLLHSQETLLDGSEPEIIIIPLLTVEQVLGWNGRDEYEAMAITCGSESKGAAAEVLKYARFCKPEEIERGRILLEAFTRGIASSVKQHDVTEAFAPDEPKSERALAAWVTLVREIKRDGRANVFLPKVLLSLSQEEYESMRVAKGEMSTRFSLPDPFLVAVKAVVSYSKLCGKALMPACPDPGSDASFDDDNSDDDVPARDFSSILASLANPGRQQVELFSDGS